MLIAPDLTLLAAQQSAHAAVLQVYVAIAQAVLTLLAVGVAIAVPAWQVLQASKRESRARFIEARELANVLLPAVKEWTVKMAILAGFARTNRVVHVFEKHASMFEVPKAIREQIGRLHILGEAALPLQDAIHLVNRSDLLWDEYDDAAKGNLADDLAEYATQQAHDTTYRMKGLLLVASTALESLFSDGEKNRNQTKEESPWDYGKEVDAYIRNDKLGEKDSRRARASDYDEVTG